jgi:hypothetical protein
MAKPNRGQMELLREVVARRCPEQQGLLEAIESDTASRSQRHALCEFIGAEFAETGLDANSEPTLATADNWAWPCTTWRTAARTGRFTRTADYR